MRYKDHTQHLVRDLASGRPMLLEALAAEANRDPERRAQFLLQALVAGRANTETVLPRTAFQVNGTLCALSEVPLGEKLEALWLPLDRGVALDLCLDIARGLSSLHEQGIVHGAVRCDGINVHLGDDRAHASLTDVGYCVPAAEKSLLDIHSHIALAPDRLPPELCSGGPFQYQADIYAFGAVSYEMLSGVPWSRNARPHLPPEVPRELSELVWRCLARNPAQRPRTMMQVVRELEHLRRAEAAWHLGSAHEAQRSDPLVAAWPASPPAAADGAQSDRTPSESASTVLSDSRAAQPDGGAMASTIDDGWVLADDAPLGGEQGGALCGYGDEATAAQPDGGAVASTVDDGWFLADDAPLSGEQVVALCGYEDEAGRLARVGTSLGWLALLSFSVAAIIGLIALAIMYS